MVPFVGRMSHIFILLFLLLSLLLDDAQGLMSPIVIKFVAVKEVAQGPAEVGMCSLHFRRRRVVFVQHTEGLTHGVKERDAIRDGQAPPTPGDDEGGLEQPR